MPGKIVTCTNLDDVRIEILGEGQAATIPASLILAMDRVLTAALVREESLDVDLVEDDATGEQGWQATLDMGVGAVGQMAPTPWGAILKLAEVLER